MLLLLVLERGRERERERERGRKRERKREERERAKERERERETERVRKLRIPMPPLRLTEHNSAGQGRGACTITTCIVGGWVGDDSVAICLKPSNSLLCEEAMGRSRSPRRCINRRYIINTRQISKVVAMFGRHPEKRPAGLYVDETSSFYLSDFMQCWANDEGLSRDDVLDALYEHKYNMRNDYKRFKISKVPCEDDYIIKVYARENVHVKTRFEAGMAPWRCRREQNWENKPRHDDDETHHDKDQEPILCILMMKRPMTGTQRQTIPMKRTHFGLSTRTHDIQTLPGGTMKVQKASGSWKMVTQSQRNGGMRVVIVTKNIMTTRVVVE